MITFIMLEMEIYPSRTESSPNGRRPRKKAGDWKSLILERWEIDRKKIEAEEKMFVSK